MPRGAPRYYTVLPKADDTLVVQRLRASNAAAAGGCCLAECGHTHSAQAAAPICVQMCVNSCEQMQVQVFSEGEVSLVVGFCWVDDDSLASCYAMVQQHR
jgi:hypothetical protein